jgi:TonB-dependent receptor
LKTRHLLLCRTRAHATFVCCVLSGTITATATGPVAPSSLSDAREGASELPVPTVAPPIADVSSATAPTPAIHLNPPATSPAPAARNAEATDSPRERGRVLQKRNPIASEYLAPGSLGRSPGASADGEGNDFRAFFPATGQLVRTPAPSQLSGFLVYQLQSNRAEPGFEARQGWRGGKPGARWALDARANVTAATRIIEHYEAAWAPRTPLPGEGDSPVYFLERPRLSQDRIATRTRTTGLHTEREFGEKLTVFATVVASDYDDAFYRNRLELNTGRGHLHPPSAAVPPGTSTQTAGAYQDAGARRYFAETITARDIRRVQTGGRAHAEDWELEFALYHATWRNRALSDAWNFTDRGLDLAYRLDDPYLPQLVITNGVDLGELAAARFSDRRVGPGRMHDADWAARADFERRLAWAGGTAWLSAGALHRQKRRINTPNSQVFLADPAAPRHLGEMARTTAPGRVVRRAYDLPAGLDPAAGRAAATGPGFIFSESRTVIESAQSLYTTAEAVQGAYLSGTWRHAGWEATLGLRGERTRTASLGTVISPEDTDDDLGPELRRVVDQGVPVVIRRVPGANRYSTWLPSLAVGYRLSEQWAVRATAHGQVMRPQYFDTVNYRRVHPPTRTLSEGNPDLKPTTIRTVAAAVDYAAPRTGDWSAALYTMAVDDFFYSAQRFETIEGAVYTASRIENGDTGSIHGFQVHWTQVWRPARSGTWRPTLAYVYSASAATLPTRPADPLPLPERSRHLLRVALAREAGPWNASAELSRQSPSLDDVGPSLERDGYRDTVTSLSLQVGWRPTERDRLSLAVQNLTNAPERSYEGGALRATRNQYSSPTARLAWERRL